MLRGGGVNAAMRSRDKTIFSGAVKSISSKNARACGRARGHVPRTHGPALLDISYGHARELDVRAAGQTRYFYRGPRWSVAELKASRVMLIHDPVRDF